MKIVTVLGARPQFIKAAALSRALRGRHEEVIVHTGQHYDKNMSDIFFDELGIPTPAHFLDVGSAGHGAQTGAMLHRIEAVLLDECPDMLLVFGDTNSTLAGALAAAKLHIPIAHVEAGLRSFNRRMPEEINRVLTDHLSSMLFAPSEAARENLRKEGIVSGVHVVGDIMLDVALRSSALRDPEEVSKRYGVSAGSFVLATLHRAENTDDEATLATLIGQLAQLPSPVILLAHPRTSGRLSQLGIHIPDTIRVATPAGHADTLALLRAADVVCTDSGGLQKEAYFLGTPCVTLRNETEWTETLATGWNILCPPRQASVPAAVMQARSSRRLPRPDLYGTGDTARLIVDALS